jgi:hypothetical protein
MHGLDNAEVEFITYERSPFPTPAKKLFSSGLEVRLEKDRYRVLESGANLGEGRGRVRRLSVMTPDGHRLSLLTNSEEDAAWLVATMFARWTQENAFKHGVERWGINQLDGRSVVPFAPDMVIANPARRRLDRDLQVLRVREGELRRKIARAIAGEASDLNGELEAALAAQRRLEARRPAVPERIALEDSELRDELVHHAPDYKTTLDCLRMACANVESDLASLLAPGLNLPDEAKQVVKNLFNATGSIRFGQRQIAVTLDPAGTTNEREAIAALLKAINRRRLSHPGDPECRPIRFQSQVS